MFDVSFIGHLPIHEPNLSKNGSQSDENETYSDQEFDNEFREIPTFQPDYMKIESEFTPTEETVAGFNKVILISSTQAHFLLKFICSEKATKFCKIFTLLLTVCTVKVK